MALTAVQVQVFRGVDGEDLKLIKVTTGAADYVTGGYPILPSLFLFTGFATDGYGTGLPPVAGNYAIVGDGVGTPYAVINPVNGNLQLFATTTGVELAAGATPAYIGFIEAFGH
jgi:hypothetical protein